MYIYMDDAALSMNAMFFSYKVAIDPLQRCQALVVYHQADVRVPSCGDVHIMSCCIRKSLLNYIRK